MPDEIINSGGKGAELNQDAIERLRRRAFNPELRDLVDRVMGNEPESAGAVPALNDIDKLPEEELLLRMYRLLYMTKSIADNRGINTSFKPFGMKRDFLEAGALDSIAEYIKNRMNKLSFSAFAILSYSVPLRGYVPVIHNLDTYEAGNIIIGLRSGLFKKIFSSPDGIILDSGTIRDDPFLAKIFHAKGKSAGRIYFVMIERVTDELAGELAIAGEAPGAPFLPASICMIRMQEQESRPGARSITDILRKRLSLPFYLVDDTQSRGIVSGSFTGLSYPFYLLDYFFNVFLLRTEGIGLSIKLSGRAETRTAFLMKYLVSKLNHALRSDSAIIQILKNHLIILSHAGYVESIRHIIDAHNRLFDEKLSLMLFPATDFDDSIRIIQEIILK